MVSEKDNVYFSNPSRQLTSSDNRRREQPRQDSADAELPPYVLEDRREVDSRERKRDTKSDFREESYSVRDDQYSERDDLYTEKDDRVTLDEPLEIRGENPYTRAIRLYGNPLAHDESWSVIESDLSLIKLPSVDFFVNMKHTFKNKSGAENEERPCFQRDPEKNPLFDCDKRFSPIVVANKTRHRHIAGTSFETHYDGQVMARHDVSPADWWQFLDDIVTAGVSGKGAAPLVQGIGHVPMFKRVSQLVNHFTEPAAMRTIQLWQARFFFPRGLSIQIDNTASVHLNSSTSSSGSDLTPNGLSLTERLAYKRMAKQARKERAAARRTVNRRAHKGHTFRAVGLVRLIVSPLNV